MNKEEFAHANRHCDSHHQHSEYEQPHLAEQVEEQVELATIQSGCENKHAVTCPTKSKKICYTSIPRYDPFNTSTNTGAVRKVINLEDFKKKRFLEEQVTMLYSDAADEFSSTSDESRDEKAELQIFLLHFCILKATTVALFLAIFFTLSFLGLGISSDVDYHKTMIPALWDHNNAATIQFCEVKSEDDMFGYRLPGEHTCSPAGIVIRMKPGQNYTLILHNDSRERTNIHIHGLHIPNYGKFADDITRFVDPGMCLSYQYNIKPDQMGGTYYLHAHYGISTKKQVVGGAYAMVIIEENDKLLSNIDSDQLYQQNLQSIRQWVNQDLLLIILKDSEEKALDKSSGSSRRTTYLANGKHHEKLELIHNEWYRLRLLTIDPFGQRNPITFPDSCDVHVVAYDGVWRIGGPSLKVQRKFHLTGSGRVDLAIKCISSRHLTEYPILIDRKKIAYVRVNHNDRLVTNTKPFLHLPDGTEAAWEPNRPYYIRDLSHGDPALDGFYNYNIVLQDDNTINGKRHDPSKSLLDVSYNTLQDWIITNSSHHPYHMHSFQMQTFNCGKYHEDGQYYDTVAATTIDDGDNDGARNCHVRWHIVDYSHNVLVHCHNLEHYGEGMISHYRIINKKHSLKIEADGSDNFDQEYCSNIN